ncbi:MAG: hypothetical protein IKW39_05140 [Alphaproteobacteria bacterium]|nr:hypothetical protein [Alphaproteobacteria bacterium]
MNYFEDLREIIFSFTWVEILRIVFMAVFSLGAGASLKFLVNDIKEGFPLVSISVLIIMYIQIALGIYIGKPLLENPSENVSITFMVLFVLLFFTALIGLKEHPRKKQN